MAGHIPRTGQVKVSDINDVKNKHLSVTVGSTDQATIKDLHDWFHANAHMPNSDNAAPYSVSEFYKAQVLTGNATTTPESTSTYATNNNGQIYMNFDADTVVPDATETKQYYFSINDGASFTLSVDNEETFTGLDSGTYTLRWKDGFTNSQVTTGAVVTYGGVSNAYNNVQTVV